MDFVAVVDQVIALLRQRGRVAYRTLKRQFQLDDEALDDLKIELIDSQRLATDEQGTVLVWTGAADAPPRGPAGAPVSAGAHPPLAYTPSYLAEKILTSRSALEGERKQVTVLFADLKGSMEILADRDPEEARQLLDPVLERMMAAVHQYEGTVNQVMGDGIMALFGAPLAHEDHAVRACYAALHMQAAVQQYAVEVQRTRGVPLHMRIGLNAGEVVVRSIGSDLHMDYTAVGQTTHLAARMEQMAMPGAILITPAVLGLVEGFVQVKALGALPVRGLRSAHFGRLVLPGVSSRYYAAVCLAELGEITAGRDMGDDAVRLAEAVDHSYSMALALWYVGMFRLRQRDIQAAIAVLERGLALCQSTNLLLLVPLLTASLGAAYALAGRGVEARPLLDHTLQHVAAAGSRFYHRAHVLIELCEALLLVSRVEDAGVLASHLLDLSRTHTGRGYQAHAYRLLGEVARHREPPDVNQATAHYRQSLVLAEALGMRPLQAHCHRGLDTLYATTGQREPACMALATAIELYRAMDMTFWLPETEAALAQVQGR